ncbi:MAG: Bor/Iss family lipoprotein [Planctomycetota bacterium]
MKRWVSLVLVVAMMSMSLGCYSLRHTVGSGPTTGVEVSGRQWYLLWGLVPLGREDSKDLAGDAKDYRVTTRQGFSDILINIFTGLVTVYSRSVIVEK